MKLSELLLEKVLTVEISGNELLVLDNPSPESLLEKCRQWDGARGLIIGSHSYWWNISLAVHNRVAKELNPDWPAGSGRCHMYLYPAARDRVDLHIPRDDVVQASANYYLRRLIGDGRVTLYRV